LQGEKWKFYSFFLLKIKKGKKKMKISINLTKLTAIIAMTLLMTSLFVLYSSTIVEAQLADEQPVSGPLPSGATPSVTLQTKIFLSASPRLVGVGQTILINMWGHPPTHVERGFENAFMLTITKPDDTEISIGPISTYQGDATAWLEWVMDQVGTWTLKIDFLGMYYPAGYYMDGAVYTEGGSGRSYLDSAYYQPSSSSVIEVTVQEEQIFSWPSSPLPTDYWTRPVYPENRDWWPILGFYPETGVVGGSEYWPEDTNIYMSNYEFIPYVQAPNSAHMIWKRQDNIGGLVGGPAGQLSLTSGGTVPQIIYAGMVYDTYRKPGTGSSAQTYWRCYDLRTGEVYWERPLEDGESAPNIVEYAAQGAEVPGATARAGVTPYLVSIGNRILKYDPWTGSVSINVSGPEGLSGNTLYGYPYVLSIQNLGGGNYRLINWTIENNAGNWVAAIGGRQTTVENFNERITGNITFPFSRISYADYEAGIAISTSSITSPGTGTAIAVEISAASLTTGQLLWTTTTDSSTGRETFFSGNTAVADQGKFVVRMNDGPIYAWDLYNGNLAWVNEISTYPWGALGPYDVTSAYGLYFTSDYACVRAIDYDTGETVWTYKAFAPPFETPYSFDGTPTYSWHSGMMVADGKFFSFNTEHTPTEPITRGWKLHCINATTGEGIWNISTGQSVGGSRQFQGGIADGYLVHSDCYNGYLYAFGKGLSATTVTAPDISVPKGTAFTIKGTVLDQSPAQPATPCVSKETMTTQMEYLHMQRPIDGIYHNETITGVPVTLTAIGDDGSYVDIGTVTTDGYSGTFGVAWIPTAEGTYKILASFDGDVSYGSSSATTWVTVGPAPTSGGDIEPEPEPEPTPLISTELAIAIAVIAAIVIGIVAFVLLRRRE
jgi:hypothetical protein